VQFAHEETRGRDDEVEELSFPAKAAS
jgi:hypothetical protein